MSRVNVLGLPVDVIGVEAASAQIDQWIALGGRGYVCCLNVHLLEEARSDENVAAAVSGAGLVVPDGAPIAWYVRRSYGIGLARLTGSDLFDRVCRDSLSTNRTHYFAGSTPSTLSLMLTEVRRRYPGILIAGASALPFSETAAESFETFAADVRKASPDIMWVGLGAPKQELWMWRLYERLDVPVLAGVGAVFDFVAGTKSRAPVWAQQRGLEWAYRALTEPRRLGRRYFFTNASFAVALTRDLIRRRTARGGVLR
jgi:N-acetylglucosaminyldiphosphoundecaprenol N-acetyl-beta-D-mannosaminyltransferase